MSNELLNNEALRIEEVYFKYQDQMSEELKDALVQHTMRNTVEKKDSGDTLLCFHVSAHRQDQDVAASRVILQLELMNSENEIKGNLVRLISMQAADGGVIVASIIAVTPEVYAKHLNNLEL